MHERFVHRCRVIRLPSTPVEEAAELSRLRATLGPRLTRRMSALGICLTAALQEHTFEDDPALIYTTTFTESQALEKYIDGFPHPSPLLFQTSIHPGGVEQTMIARQQAVTEFYPLGGQPGIISQALKLALTSLRPRILWTGGEERGNWMLAAGKASHSTFAWALALSSQREGAEARLTWDPEAPATDEKEPTTESWITVLSDRQSLEWTHPGSGGFCWEWL